MESLLSRFDRVCDPSPELFPDDIERKIQLRRNQKFLTMQLLIVALFSLYVIFLKENPNFTDYWFLSMFTINITVFCMIGRSRPTLFKIIYGAVLTFSGPLALYLHRDGVFGCWSTVYFFPMLLLYFSDCRTMYVIQVALQLVYMDSYYKGKMIEALNERTSQAFVQDLMSCQLFAIIFSSIVVYSIGVSLVDTFKQDIIHGETKRKELEVQKTFILGFSHEIRNLINSLIGNIQLSLLEKVPPKVKGHLEDAEVGAGLLIQLINNILDTGNLDVGELDINHSDQKIYCTLERIWNMCGYLLKAKNLKGQLQILKNLPHHLRLDHERFMQILINLIVNAVKFTDKGSVDVKLEWIPKTPTVTEDCFFPCPFDDEDEGIFEKDKAFSLLDTDCTTIGLNKKKWNSGNPCESREACKGLIKVSVTDTGYGVTPENLPKAFDRFWSPIYKDRPNSLCRLGTTIGLYVTKELCQRMGGEVKIFSKVDRGTSFIACIPAEQVLPNTLLKRGSSSTCSGSGTSSSQETKLRAMIVDDLSFNIVVLTSYLQRMKLEIADTAADGLDAFTKYVKSVKAGKKFDIVTMDVEMPVMDGKESARKIREFERENGLEPCFLVMVSGNVCESEIIQCMKHDGNMLANHFLKKPATYDDLSRVINEYFSLNNKA